ncbi:Low conductance mechanosensitive channel YnaI [Sphingomonas sp. S2M10]|jgi:small-conductance mechanosensitive channel|uniref:mechanosensitive ion channel family protein n=1 Tax=Sphingomonas sp. S2M10 TaxID=2705010 RepID=UPI0014563204|nr:mechanosensitive ion channel family protein [Sphingomonas sp. S2M10]NLS25780.1 Low conductance mechanosensitive channel YnaI [Sphingomonas sp. S2M10]
MPSPSPTPSPVHTLSQAQIQQNAQLFVSQSRIWLEAHWLQVLIAFGIGAAIVALLHWVRRWGIKLCARKPGITGWGSIIGRAVARTGNFFIVMTSAKLVSGYAYAPEVIENTVRFLFTIAAAFQAAIWARELILGAIEYRTQSEGYQGESLLNALGLIRVLISFALFAIALVVVLSNVGVNVTGLVAGLGVGGIAIGLAAQGIFADLFAALSIIFDRPFRRGDKVQYDSTIGVIETIGLKSTRIRAFTGEQRIISNRNLLDKEIQNISNRDHVRIQLDIGVAYETPPEKLEALPEMLSAIVAETGMTVARASFEGFGGSSVDFKLWFDVPGDDWPSAHKARDKVIIGILRRFAEEGLSIPFPTQTTYTAGPDGTLIMPYPEVQPVRRVDKDEGER